MSQRPEGFEPIEPAPELHEPVERRYPSTIGGACYLVVLLVASLGIALVALSDWRVGVRVVAGALGAAALLRLVLPRRDAGMLAVRHRSIDVIMLGGVAAALWFLAGDIPDQPR
ncbi:DUF3017 domain-containing protein [Nocardioides sp.]|uniref:DUF3017 domain-containing protein n=1 Tax=Nocardioides sp. TaxID=35761 RepID=UPI002B268445|nr:DUF3017 domain-containing protein [Nocardioides sp.]